MSKKVKGFLGNGPAPKTAKPNFNASMFVGGINSIIEEEELQDPEDDDEMYNTFAAGGHMLQGDNSIEYLEPPYR